MNDSISDLEALREQLEGCLLKVDWLTARQIFTRSYPDLKPHELVEAIVVPVLERIGNGWETGQYSLSQVYMSGRICEELSELILPATYEARLKHPRLAIVTLQDYHMLGKRIVCSTLRASGLKVDDYGRMATAELAERVITDQVKILLVSVLMLPSALQVKELRLRLDLAHAPAKIVVGGAPFRFDDQLWRQVGADACGKSATEAIRIIHQMLEEIS